MCEVVQHLFEVEDGFIDGVHLRRFSGESEAFFTAGVLECLGVADFGMMFVLEECVEEVALGLDVGDAGE